MIKPIIKSVGFVLWTGFCYVVILIAKKSGNKERYNNAIMFCKRGLLGVCGIRLKVSGEPATDRPLMVVSNHISYLDIALLGSQMPVRFTPKSDIAKWPVIGNVCRLCDVIFIDRNRNKIKEMKEVIHQSLSEGNAVSLFPEATTGDGIHTHPFKPGFFDLALSDFGNKKLTIQPVALTYTHIRKLPIDRTQWPDIAWYGDMDFASHIFHVFSLSPIDAEIVFLPPIVIDNQYDRKELAQLCQDKIDAAIEEIRSRPAQLQLPKGNVKKKPPLQVSS